MGSRTVLAILRLENKNINENGRGVCLIGLIGSCATTCFAGLALGFGISGINI